MNTTAASAVTVWTVKTACKHYCLLLLTNIEKFMANAADDDKAY